MYLLRRRLWCHLERSWPLAKALTACAPSISRLTHHQSLTDASVAWTGHSLQGDSGGALPIPEEEEPVDGLTSDSIPLTMFSSPGAAGFKVRGPTYLQDKKKVRRHLCEAPFSPPSLHGGG